MVQISYDFDNNGVADAIEVAQYDAEGRQIASEYRYDGDGLPDRLNLVGTQPTGSAFEYDATGRLLRLTDTREGGQSEFSFVYGADGRAVRGDIVAGAHGMVFNGQIEFSYTNGLLTQLAQSVEGQPFVAVTRYDHDDRGRRSSQVQGQVGDPAATRNDYTWTADDQLASARLDLDADGENVLYTMTYEGGVQTRTVKAVGGVVRYTVDFTYDERGRVVQARFDAGGDGSIDAVWTLTWEDGPCIELVLPLWEPLLDTRTGWGSSLRGETRRCGG